MPWRPIPLSYGVAIYPFQPGSSSAELPLQIGDQLYVIEQGGSHGDWYRGYLVAPPSLLSALTSDGRAVPGADARVFSGIFPKCCVEIREELAEDVSRPMSSASSQARKEKPAAPVPMLKIGDETTLSSEPLVDEISACLREWYLFQLPELVLDRQYDQLEKTAEVMTKLEYSRRQLLNDVLTEFEKSGLREEAVMNLVRASKLLSGEVIVRDSAGRLLTGDDSAVEMAKRSVVGVLLDVSDMDQNHSANHTNGHTHENEDGRLSSLGRSGTVTSTIGRSSRLSKRLSKISINNDDFNFTAEPTKQIDQIPEESPNHILSQLHSWKQLSSPELMQLLPKVMFAPESELVDQLEDTFDALFAIQVHKAGESKYEDLVFNDVVRLLGIMNDRRFNIKGVIDQYLLEQFDHPLAAPCLLRSLTRMMQSVSDPQSARDMRAFFKVGQYVIKIIVISHQQSKINSANSSLLANHKSFKEDMQSILFGLQMMMRSETASLIGSKTLLVQHFHSWPSELLPVFTTDEVIRIAVNFVDSCQDARGKLSLHRLVMILNYAKLDELWFGQPERALLIKNCLRWLSPYWGSTQQVTETWREQVRICCSVVAELLRYPSSTLHDFMPKIVASYSAILAAPASKKKTLSYLFASSYPFTAKSVTSGDQADEPLLELAALISGICTIDPLIAINLPDQNLSSYLFALLACQNSVLDGDAYPQSWLSLHIFHHRASMTVLQYTFKVLLRHFLPAPEFAEQFDMDLWKAYLNLLLKLITSESLALENFSEQKRRAIWKIGGDIRESGASLLRSSWENIGWETSPDDERRYNLKRLGGYQVQYVPGLIPQIMCLCLSMHEGLRRVAVEILQTMIVSEWALSEDLALIETEMVTSLDIIFKTRTPSNSNEATDKLFLTELRDLFSTISDYGDDALWTTLDELLTSLDELVSLLSARSTATTEADLSTHTLALTEFMASMQNTDLFVRYIHDLANSYDVSAQPLAAAQTLARHAALYTWDADPSSKLTSLPALGTVDTQLPEQSPFARKESLYLAMISRYEEAAAWTEAMRCYKELAEQYENTTLEYGKLARAQRAMARINEERMKERVRQRRELESRAESRVEDRRGPANGKGEEDDSEDEED